VEFASYRLRLRAEAAHATRYRLQKIFPLFHWFGPKSSGNSWHSAAAQGLCIVDFALHWLLVEEPMSQRAEMSQ